MEKPRFGKKVISADEFDTLELAAMEKGGIASGDWFRLKAPEGWSYERDAECPMCINGLGIYAGVNREYIPSPTQTGASCPTSIEVTRNDTVVEYLVEKGRYTVGADGIERVTFADFCEVGNIHRGA